MDIHHNTSFKSILEDDSIFPTCICFCLSKGARLWLIVRPPICSFRISHFTFTLTLHFHFNFIQLSTFNFLTCECGHGLDAFGRHLACCLFRDQWITTHDAIRDMMMYALTTKCMERAMICLYVKSFITNGSWGLCICWMWWWLTQHERQWLWVSLVDQQVQQWNLT